MTLRPAPADRAMVKRFFVRGRAAPKGVVWLGFRSFWGHMRHFVASAVATEDVDSRDWMTPDEPEELAMRVVSVLGASSDARDAGPHSNADVLSMLGRDLWIDFVADTGDDLSVSRAVAGLVAAEYELPDPARPGEYLVAPRGDVLLFGGDTAYPVATAQEISNRVLVPFNEVLARKGDGKPRVLLGIPGNHDWYDGLDGFGRLFRRRPADEDVDARPSFVGIPFRQLEHAADWARELVMGGKMEKPEALVISGYEPVQSASYFILPLTREIHLVAVDRQLRVIDHRQERFHRRWLDENPQVSPWVVMPDPLFAFGELSPTGAGMVQSLSLAFGVRDHFLLSGDIHHYDRIEEPGLLHVVAGGGGAFLHPAPMVARRRAMKAQWPTPEQSRALLWSVPFKIAIGRSGFIPHAMLAGLYAVSMIVGAGVRLLGGAAAAPVATLVIATVVLSLMGGLRKKPRAVAALAFAFALLLTLLPIGAFVGLDLLLSPLRAHLPMFVIAALTLGLTVVLGAGLVGVYVALLTRLGIEETQAFSTLDHPGYKHFLRLRVRHDGEGIDAWCVGLTDPLRPGEEPVLVDSFRWRPGARS